MDFIDFEKVSLDEARAVHQADQTTIREDENWEPKRKPKTLSDLKLENETCMWLMSLPGSVRPLHLARHFPRIANRLAVAWQRPLVCNQHFDELMLDHRGTRRGFSMVIAKEIADLRDFFSKEVHVPKQDIWNLGM